MIPYFWLSFQVFKFNKNKKGIFLQKGHTYPSFTKWVFFFNALCEKKQSCAAFLVYGRKLLLLHVAFRNDEFAQFRTSFF
ncbi:hypothetical protein ESP47_13020 [Heyndrickxia coagulans]|uniref:Uncharacterized protein n=1 Tax=Heyndrickxia coagulans TaxID=1398 RepID=A0AAN0T205_HEYCO|nr:hypothetical protein SB48_HM08orf00220 [Heyndrickxia coagulans]AKN53413.1 hypothetical protein AB434_1008 [Heyndrickxia coagulans]ATW81641.1 hypothetical protein CIW84_00655 [Heyndrickxia coagulans]KGB29848.1 hypothetical protein IE89_08320 [Heyndrickxia coagulans]KXT22217.1 hypothetical protein UZ35_00260 [Heyndrickxia coagulans]